MGQRCDVKREVKGFPTEGGGVGVEISRGKEVIAHELVVGRGK